jgi:predicted molibdopterin-dependent oxidoreductase YjgC
MTNALPRLTEPMVRDNGTLRIATWDEALDRAAAGLKAAVDRNGAEGVGIFSCSKATNEVNYVAQKFIRQVRSARTTSTAATGPDTPQASSVWRRYSEQAAGRARTGGRGHRRHPPVGIERPRDAPHLLPPRAQGRAERGAKLVVVDPAAPPRRPGPTVAARRTSARTSPSPTRRPRDPRRGLENRAFIEPRDEGFDAYRALLQEYTLERGEAVTGVDADAIRDGPRTPAPIAP